MTYTEDELRRLAFAAEKLFKEVTALRKKGHPMWLEKPMMTAEDLLDRIQTTLTVAADQVAAAHAGMAKEVDVKQVKTPKPKARVGKRRLD